MKKYNTNKSNTLYNYNLLPVPDETKHGEALESHDDTAQRELQEEYNQSNR